MQTGWHTTQMEKRTGGLTLVVEELYSAGSWLARAFLHADWHSACHHLEPHEYPTAVAALDAVDAYARQLGPVEPVLAMLRVFAGARGHVRRARRRAA